ncbi:hypothetical protein [Proteiniclasticum sp. QWL-01]|uniref:hypothetical protein n=1 Tax=Proteiniclasticum sp. QWL-01 TaxID=3036945 RepID=UPI0021FCA4D0|nr:hypothetical protein [Proteiniclasticum sp. QWL-01]UUM11428.1 hypothetical protein NQU17_12325 [Clostridiaceae bacterium HFYG-1003]WFF72839.1 hypothetical protein P6M73_16480 [Proteiniclasticum sp. QWL-01]
MKFSELLLVKNRLRNKGSRRVKKTPVPMVSVSFYWSPTTNGTWIRQKGNGTPSEGFFQPGILGRAQN